MALDLAEDRLSPSQVMERAQEVFRGHTKCEWVLEHGSFGPGPQLFARISIVDLCALLQPESLDQLLSLFRDGIPVSLVRQEYEIWLEMEEDDRRPFGSLE